MKGEKDELLQLLQNGELDALGAALLEENERLANDPCFIPPTKTQPEILADAYRELEAQEKRRIRSGRTKSIPVFKYATIIALVLATLAVTAMSVEAFRIPIMNFFTEQQERSTRISPQSNEDPQPSQYDPNDVESYTLRWLPEGYVDESVDDGSDYYQINYINEDSVQLRFRVYFYHEYWFDTEDADIVEPLQINGMEGYYVQKDGRSMLTWADEENLIVFQLLGNLPRDSIIKIAESSGLKN